MKIHGKGALLNYAKYDLSQCLNKFPKQMPVEPIPVEPMIMSKTKIALR